MLVFILKHKMCIILVMLTLEDLLKILCFLDLQNEMTKINSNIKGDNNFEHDFHSTLGYKTHIKETGSPLRVAKDSTFSQ